MSDYAFTNYFENEVLRKRPYLKKSGVFGFVKTHSRSNHKSIIIFAFGVKSMNWKGMYCVSSPLKTKRPYTMPSQIGSSKNEAQLL